MVLSYFLLLLSYVVALAQGLGSSSCITFDPDQALVLASRSRHSQPLPLLLDRDDTESVHIAARTFADDVERVTSKRPGLYNNTLPDDLAEHGAVVIGSWSANLIQKLHLGQGYRNIRGQWEAYHSQVVPVLLPTSGHALSRLSSFSPVSSLVVVGSDPRGTIFALYELSEQMGISPFYWWADVPVTPRDVVAFSQSAVCAHGEPTVKYRGWFINDEQPVLWTWARHHFNIPRGEPPFQVGMYEKMFELMLRLKANFLWPAMWASMFSVDGLDTSKGLPDVPTPGPNQILANRMGIVMGTSHHEPMGRNKPEWDIYGRGPWNFTANENGLLEFWRYGAERAQGLDTMFTLGMRGDGDLPLAGANVQYQLFQNVTKAQQDILRDVYGASEMETVPQLWRALTFVMNILGPADGCRAMYDEMMGYFANGLEVPDDVITLLSDDTYGNIVGVMPEGAEHRAGGGLYYHADFVGPPRGYRWINTVSMSKMWQQLNTALAFNTSAAWILNVGDLKFLELPIEFFLSISYDSDRWPRNSFRTFLLAWAAREFGETVDAGEVADIMGTYSMYASRRKAELVNSTTWSIVNDLEAEKVLSQWKELQARASIVHDALPHDRQLAFYELVYAPLRLNTNLNQLYISAGRSNLYATQGRTSANIYAQDALDCLQRDYDWTEEFHQINAGKWRHMLDQPHINYQYWQWPSRNSLPPVSFVQADAASYTHDQTLARFTVENSLGSHPGDNQNNCIQGYQCGDPSMLPLTRYGAPSRWLDVGSGGNQDFNFTILANESWIRLSHTHGFVKADGTADQRIYLGIDWEELDAEIGLDRKTKSGQFVIGLRPDPNPQMVIGLVSIATSSGDSMTIDLPVLHHSMIPQDFHGHLQGDGYVAIEAGHYSRNSTASTSEGASHSWQEIEWYGRTHSGLEVMPVTSNNFSLGQGPSLSYDFYAWPFSGYRQRVDGGVDVTVQLGPMFNYLFGKSFVFGLQMDDNEPVLVNPIPPALPGKHPEDWDEVTTSEIRSHTVAMRMGSELGQSGAHTLTVWGMTSGIVLERIIIDFGGSSARGYSYLGRPESKIV